MITGIVCFLAGVAVSSLLWYGFIVFEILLPAMLNEWDNVTPMTDPYHHELDSL